MAYIKKFRSFTEKINEGTDKTKESTGWNESEHETLIYDEIGEDIVRLQDQIDAMLKWEITDPKWIAALKGIQSAFSKFEDTVAKADQKLGAIPYNS